MSLARENQAAVVGSNTLTNFTITAGNVLVVGVAYVDGSTQPTDVVWDAAGVNQALTNVKRQRESVNTGYSVDIWYRVNPTAGSNKTITVTMSGAASRHVSAVSLTGGDTSTPFGDMTLTGGTADSEAGNSDPVTVTVTTAAGEIVLDFMISDTASTVGADQTAYLDDNVTSGNQMGASYQDGANGGVMSWTKDGGGTQAWCIAAVSVKPAGGGGGASKKGLSLRGVS